MARDVATVEVYVMGFITMPLAASSAAGPRVTAAVKPEEHSVVVPVVVTEPFAQ